ncbi:SDR family oxidoreductase [Streptomyces triculaminicus]|uniref:SDR family oxidoreductase n=1 Tax=Streptomyces triculaminicus TaxID=2816232 RepID=UPI0034095F81
MTCVRIVTGAAGLIGTALTRHLAEQPGTLLALDTTPGPHPTGHPVITMDATGEEFPELLATHLGDATRAELFHTAGHVPDLARITDTPVDDFTRTVTDNLTTTYATLRAFALTARQHGVPAAAVLLGSAGATRAHRYRVAYDAAKAGIEALARSFTVELGQHLAVRTFALGPVAQSATTAADGDRLPALLDLVPRGTYADLDETAAAIAALGGPAFDPIAGHTLTYDGGLSIQLRPVAIERPPAHDGGALASGRRADTGSHRPHTDPIGDTR